MGREGSHPKPKIFVRILGGDGGAPLTCHVQINSHLDSVSIDGKWKSESDCPPGHSKASGQLKSPRLSLVPLSILTPSAYVVCVLVVCLSLLLLLRSTLNSWSSFFPTWFLLCRLLFLLLSSPVSTYPCVSLSVSHACYLSLSVCRWNWNFAKHISGELLRFKKLS